ncbi:hypothetical protein CPLU01_02575 [Colletotrichum plurivorum]|uniref:Uncharacterized protein n=1 Tax=Colletotrichum plurivorum TaxID=2175906 RepID=A0A8H6KV58_9PEZI|nr:hypothetical protein CPLU01_02575 [Colletotrichum plurivorum]
MADHRRNRHHPLSSPGIAPFPPALHRSSPPPASPLRPPRQFSRLFHDPSPLAFAFPEAAYLRHSSLHVGHPPADSLFPSPEYRDGVPHFPAPGERGAHNTRANAMGGSRAAAHQASCEDSPDSPPMTPDLFAMEDLWSTMPTSPSEPPRPYRSRDARPRSPADSDEDDDEEIPQHCAHSNGFTTRMRLFYFPCHHHGGIPPFSPPTPPRRRGRAPSPSPSLASAIRTGRHVRYAELPADEPARSRTQYAPRCRCFECNCPRFADVDGELLTEEGRTLCGYCRAYCRSRIVY